MQKFLIILSLLILSNFSFASDDESKITSVEVQELTALTSTVELPRGQDNPIQEISILLDGLMAIGKKIWPIIEAGRPVITNGLVAPISVLPHLEGENGVLYQMANWSIPKSKSFRLSYKNVYGLEVIGFTYTLYFQYGGSFKGVGKYLTSLHVQASDIYAAWGGFKFDVNSELVSIANVGSDEAPVASAIIKVNCKAKSILNENQSAQSFYVDGNGNLNLLK